MTGRKETSILQSRSGVVRLRSLVPVTRRQFAGAAALASASTLVMSPAGPALSATTVKYHGWQGYDNAIDANEFLQQNDATLSTTYINSNEEIIATALAGGIGVMDLVTPVHLYVPLYTKAGLLEPLDADKIPNLKGVFPELSSPPGLVIDGQLYAVPFTWGSIPLMWNAEVIKEPPTSWWDLFNPEYKGKTAAVQDLNGLMINFAYTATGTKTPARLSQEELDETIALLIRFKKEQALTISPSYGDLAAMFASGDVIIAPGWEPMSVWAGPDAPELKWDIPKEGTVSFVDCYGIITNAPNRELNHKILNHVLSPEAQVLTAELNATAVTVAAAVPMLSDGVREIYPYDDIGSYFERAGGLTEMYPLEPDGEYVTYDDVVAAWERFLRA